MASRYPFFPLLLQAARSIAETLEVACTLPGSLRESMPKARHHASRTRGSSRVAGADSKRSSSSAAHGEHLEEGEGESKSVDGAQDEDKDDDVKQGKGSNGEDIHSSSEAAAHV